MEGRISIRVAAVANYGGCDNSNLADQHGDGYVYQNRCCSYGSFTARRFLINQQGVDKF